MLQKLKFIILIFSLILFNNTNLFASNIKNQINYAKSNISQFMIKEWGKTVEFQKKKFNELKTQTKSQKRETNKIFNHCR